MAPGSTVVQVSSTVLYTRMYRDDQHVLIVLVLALPLDGKEPENPKNVQIK